MYNNIIKQINEFQVSTAYVFIGGSIMSLGIRGLFKGFLNEFDYYELITVLSGLIFTIYGLFIFVKAKKNLMRIALQFPNDK